MTPGDALWIALALGVAILDWLSVARGWQRLGYLTKPGVMGVLLAWLLSHHSVLTFVLALGFSLLGDVFLMLPRERFVAGLGAFLLAHLAYLAGFLGPGWPSGEAPWLLLILVTLLGGGFYRRLAPALRQRGQARLRPAVALYTAALSAMLWAAGSTWWQGWPSRAALSVSVGAFLFFASDGLLAWNRFVRPIPHARLKVRVLYHLGQLLLAMGIVLHG